MSERVKNGIMKYIYPKILSTKSTSLLPENIIDSANNIAVIAQNINI